MDFFIKITDISFIYFIKKIYTKVYTVIQLLIQVKQKLCLEL